MYNLKCIKQVATRTVNNNGDKTKQYFKHMSAEDFDNALLVRSLVLSKNFSLYCRTHKVLREYRGYFLFERYWGVKVQTLTTALSLLDLI